MNKEFQLIRCETKLKDFMSCELFSKMASEQQNALKVYNELKVYCHRFGHTYIERKDLEKRMNMSEVRTWEAVSFLRKHEVLKVEKEKITLRNLYKYENDIADCLHHLIKKEPWRIDLDVRKILGSAACERDQLGNNSCASASGMNGEDNKSDLNRESDPIVDETDATSITLDLDQVQAAEMMCANPVTVISGKGGCGKTTVVSMIFKAAMGQEEKNREDTCSTSEQVLLTAPTGRAASLLTKKTCFTAYTMHQVRGVCGCFT